MKQDALLSDLIGKVERCLTTAKHFKQLSKEELTYSPDKDTWNVLQCLEHCNRYWDFYHKEFNRHLDQNKSIKHFQDFKPGFWGNLFSRMMLPKEGAIFKMKTFKSKNPSILDATLESIDQYISQQEELLIVLEKAKDIDLNKHRCKLTVPLVKMNLGASLQFIIFHNVRHLEQAEKLMRQ